MVYLDSLAGRRRTTLQTFYKLKLLIIGAGKWSQKIETVCKVSTESIVVEIISARDFLANDKTLNKNLNFFDRIWISTRPIFQLELLKRISGFYGLVIIEKPYAQNSFELFNLSELAASQQLSISLSQPWTFSEGWNQFKNYSKSEGLVDFSVIRVGQLMHYYLNPIEDWLPHDLNLILDFIDDSTIKIGMDSINWNPGKDRVEFELLINNKYRFIIDSGFYPMGRIARWESSGREVDFINSIITEPNGQEVPIIEKHPIINLLKGVGQSVTGRLERDIKFHFEVMNALGL